MLKRLYSETNLLLEDIHFKPGLNLILGRYSQNREERGINGIGKSTLVRLISYAFLSETAEKLFQSEKYDFLRKENHTFILEFIVNNERYKIKRSFLKNDSVYFGKDENKLSEFSKSELKTVLVNKFFPFKEQQVFFEGSRFGTLMHFFIKDDLEQFGRKQPLEFLPFYTNSREIAIYNFFLLGLPTKNIIDFDELCKEYEVRGKTVKSLLKKIKDDTGKSIEEFKSERIKIENRINLLEKSLDDYNFLDVYKDIEKELLLIIPELNTKLGVFHAKERELHKVRASYRFDQEVDTQVIQRIYNETLDTFGDFVKKTIDEVIQFKKELLENRNKHLIARENALEAFISNLLAEISELEKRKAILYRRLDEKGALDSIKNTYEQLILEKTQLERNMRSLIEVDEIENSLADLEVKISEAKRAIQNDLKDHRVVVDTLRGLFQNILSNAIFLDEEYSKAYFDIAVTRHAQKNQLPFKIEVEIPKADALGQSRLKLVAYDLMIFLHNVNSRRRVPDFLVHDGVFHGISMKTKVNTLNYIYHQSLEAASNNPFQYIVTFNEDEIHIPEEKAEQYGIFDFNWMDHLIAQYEDIPNKMIFKRILL